jgi:hypothetical protein
LLNEGVTEKKNTIQLVDFFKLLQKVDFNIKREFYLIVTELRRMRNITNKKQNNSLSGKKESSRILREGKKNCLKKI